MRMIKIGADGARLPVDATEWVAVELPEHGLMFSRTSASAWRVDFDYGLFDSYLRRYDRGFALAVRRAGQ